MSNELYVPVLERWPPDTAHTEMQRLLELSTQQAATIARLRAALAAEPAPQPVAWLVTSRAGHIRAAWTDAPSEEAFQIAEIDGDTITPLYAHALAAKPTWTMDECAQVIKTMRYIQGIAERGQGRPMRDDETLESFVLGYVKQLEAAPPALAAEPALVAEFERGRKAGITAVFDSMQTLAAKPAEHPELGVLLYAAARGALATEPRPLTDAQIEAAFNVWHYAHGNNTQGIKWVDDLLRACWKAAIELVRRIGNKP